MKDKGKILAQITGTMYENCTEMCFSGKEENGMELLVRFWLGLPEYQREFLKNFDTDAPEAQAFINKINNARIPMQ